MNRINLKFTPIARKIKQPSKPTNQKIKEKFWKLKKSAKLRLEQGRKIGKIVGPTMIMLSGISMAVPVSGDIGEMKHKIEATVAAIGTGITGLSYLKSKRQKLVEELRKTRKTSEQELRKHTYSPVYTYQKLGELGNILLKELPQTYGIIPREIKNPETLAGFIAEANPAYLKSVFDLAETLKYIQKTVIVKEDEMKEFRKTLDGITNIAKKMNYTPKRVSNKEIPNYAKVIFSPGIVSKDLQKSTSREIEEENVKKMITTMSAYVGFVDACNKSQVPGAYMKK